MKRSIVIGLGCAAVLAACITINVYFPEAAVKELSQQIEEEVQKKAAGEPTPAPEPTPTPVAQPEGGAPESLLSCILSLGATTAYAAAGSGRGTRDHQPGDPQDHRLARRSGWMRSTPSRRRA